jgi:hypothetical protein
MSDTNKAWKGANIHKDLKNQMENDIRHKIICQESKILS